MTRLIDADALIFHSCNDMKGDCPYWGSANCGVCQKSLITRAEIYNAPTVIPEEMKPLIDKTMEILPQLTDAIVENLPRILDDIDICQECEYRKTSFKEADQTKWIPVSERLPEKIGTYLVTLEYKEHGKGITTLWYHGKDIGWDLRVADVVVAWQPLPEPYKEADEDEL